jgi:hypothetical protein
MEEKQSRSFRLLSPEAKRLLALLAHAFGISQTAMLQLAIRENTALVQAVGISEGGIPELAIREKARRENVR